MKFKSIKSMILTTGMIVGISLLSSNAYAATYTAVSGDSLYKISKVFNTSVSNLMNDNNLTSTNINIGQKLYVSCKTHTVKKGESLYLISKSYGISLEALRRANNIYTDYIDIGQVLNIPERISSAPNASISYLASDVDLLARLITAEAQGESYDAKVAVGAVVLNRVKSNSFKNSIKDVIYEVINGYYQFTPVLNGWINKPATADSIKAANEALCGIDPTNGALFYFDTSTTNEWLLSKEVAIKIGNLIYAY